jgi:hypothetical protein
MSFLRAHLCDEIQGYYFSKPLTVDQVPDKLRSIKVRALSANIGRDRNGRRFIVRGHGRHHFSFSSSIFFFPEPTSASGSHFSCSHGLGDG